MLSRGIAEHCRFVLCFWFFSQCPKWGSSQFSLLLLLLLSLLADRNGSLHSKDKKISRVNTFVINGKSWREIMRKILT